MRRSRLGFSKPSLLGNWSTCEILRDPSKLQIAYRRSCSFFTQLHHYAPMTTATFGEQDRESELVGTEPFLLSCILMIAARYHTLPGFGGRSKSERIHSRCWSRMQGVMFGRIFTSPRARTIGTVEGLLLLSEWAPKSASPHKTPATKPAADINAFRYMTKRTSHLARSDSPVFHC